MKRNRRAGREGRGLGRGRSEARVGDKPGNVIANAEGEIDAEFRGTLAEHAHRAVERFNGIDRFFL